MKLRATETPRATPTDVLVPTLTDAATASTSASTTPVEVASTVTSWTGCATVPSEPFSIVAVVNDRITLVDSEPPPASANAGLPPETATPTATAIDWTLICASLVAVMTTLPAATIVPGFFTSADTPAS